jgi:hypothetical protein
LGKFVLGAPISASGERSNQARKVRGEAPWLWKIAIL